MVFHNRWRSWTDCFKMKYNSAAVDKKYVSSFPHILAGNDYLSLSPHICRGETNKQKTNKNRRKLFVVPASKFTAWMQPTQETQLLYQYHTQNMSMQWRFPAKWVDQIRTQRANTALSVTSQRVTIVAESQTPHSQHVSQRDKSPAWLCCPKLEWCRGYLH